MTREQIAAVDREFGVLFESWSAQLEKLAEREAVADLVRAEILEAWRISRPNHRSGTPTARLATIHAILRRVRRLLEGHERA